MKMSMPVVMLTDYCGRTDPCGGYNWTVIPLKPTPQSGYQHAYLVTQNVHPPFTSKFWSNWNSYHVPLTLEACSPCSPWCQAICGLSCDRCVICQGNCTANLSRACRTIKISACQCSYPHRHGGSQITFISMTVNVALNKLLSTIHLAICISS